MAATKYRDIVKKKNGVDDIVGIPFDDEAWAEATYFTKNNKGYGFGLTKQPQRIFRKAKRSALKRSRAYTSRISDEAWIESEVTTRLESRMKAFEIEMKLRVEEQSRMSNTSDKGTTFGDGAARVGMQLRSSPKVSTSSPLVSPSTIINVPRELYSIDVAATFGVPLTTVGDLQKLINDIDAGKHDELLSELTNEDRMETLEALGSICNSIKVDRNNADVIPCKVSYADDSINLNVDESTIPSDPIVQSVDINKSTSYAGVAGGSAKDQPNVNSNFRTLVADPVFDGVNISIPRKVVEKVSTRFEHTLYGYFIGKRMAFPVVEYYARNNWAKHGLKRIMMNSKGFFFFKFDSRAGLEAVLEGGPWLIRKSPIILKKWSMDTRLLKEELTRIPIWVKLHDVPIQVFEEDGISLIATFIGKPVMLDSYTSSMCNDSWGRSSFARCLIEVNSEADLVDVVTIGIPSLSEDDFTKETIRVEYEWRPPRCDTCKIFGHVHDYCPKKVVSPPIVATSNVVTPNAEKTNDGFQTVGKKKKRKGKSKSTNGGQFTGPSVKHNVRYEPKATTSAPKKGTTYVGYTSQSTPMLKTTGNSSKKDNLSMSNSFSALNEEEEEDEEDVENVYDESANLIQNTKAGGSSSFTAAAEADLMDVVTIGIPSLFEDDFTKETIRVEYEWRPPRCDTCKIFGHVHDYCPKKVVSPPIVATSNVVTPNAEKTNDGFQTVGKKKKRKATTSAPMKGTTYVGYTSQSTPMLKTTGNSSKKDNLSMPNSFSALNEEEDEDDEEEVENVYNESANLILNTKAGGSSSFTAAAG
ncbi:zinc knuckle CX2CX4HX4C containing protein [Tanacetum coccineum]